jgi:uncharacterized protein
LASSIGNSQQPVTAVICHLVKPGYEEIYEQWLHDIAAVAKEFDGHAGISYIRPEDHEHPEYVAILKFDRYDNLKKWLDSEVRKQWIEKSKHLVQADAKVKILTGLETWFTLPGRMVQNPPPRYKMAILSTIVIFSIAQIIQPLLNPVFAFLPPLLRSLVMTVLNVLLLTYIVMPRVTRLFYRWLYPKTR